jgi:hypothetical protein
MRNLTVVVLAGAVALAGPPADPVCETSRLLPDEPEAGDMNGFSVATDEDLAVLGAPFEDDQAANAGAAHVFKRVDGQWLEQATLLAGDGAPLDQFGAAVAVSGERALVGAPFDDDAGNGSGSAYVFHFDGSGWTQEMKLTAVEAEGADEFGRAVALSGGVALVGAPAADGDLSNDLGAAYVFRLRDGKWVQEARLLAADAASGDRFGEAVAIDGTRAIIGSPQDDDGGFASGSAYVFDFDGKSWVQQPKLTSPKSDFGDRFGESVSVLGDVAAVGAPGDDDEQTPGGAAFVYRRTDSEWQEEARLAAADGQTSDRFGEALALAPGSLVVGAPSRDTVADDEGAAYVFADDAGTWVPGATLTPGVPTLEAQFGASVASDAYTLAGAPRDDDFGAGYVFEGTIFLDCNRNGVDDRCDIASGRSNDGNGNGVPDECERVPGDINGDGTVDGDDLQIVLDDWGPCPPPPKECPADLDGDGAVDVDDLICVLLNWTFPPESASKPGDAGHALDEPFGF